MEADVTKEGSENSTDMTKIITDNEKHIRYVPVSDACGWDLGTVIPKGMASETINALEGVKRQLLEAYGWDLDSFVQNRLDFTPEELGIDRKLYNTLDKAGQEKIINDNLCKVFAPEQLDAIALAIYNVENRKQGMIVGDMTGVGKGRVAAALIRYTIKYLKKVPVFLTEKSYLFSDIYRDIIDTASDPDIPQSIKVDEKRKEIKLTKAQESAIIKEHIDNGYSPEEAEEMLQAQTERGFVMEPVYAKNKNYEDEVRKAKKTRLQIIPFILNNRSKETNVKNLKGDILYLAQSASDGDFKAAINGLYVPGNYNCVMSTYSQISGSIRSRKMEWFNAICKDTVVICDESHNASGASNTGRFLLASLQESRGAVFLSATYAKRADNMVIYAAKTSMAETGLPQEDLIYAIEKGGVPLQEIISSQLVAEGQMIRRERSYNGINILYNILDASMANTGHPEFDLSDRHYAIADAFTKLLRDIILFQDNIGEWGKTKEVAQKFLKETYGEVEIPRQYDVRKTLSSSPVFSRVFNVNNQLLFTLKCEAIADRAIQYMKQGKKPVIAFASTMESFIDDLTNEHGLPLKEGDIINADFKAILQKLLDSVLVLNIKHPDGKKTKRILDIGYLPEEAQMFYKSIYYNIKQISIGLSISPIDVILTKIRAAGFSAEEITGRSGKLEFLTDDFITARYVRRVKTAPTDLFRSFNQNKTDCLLINQSGSTGGSVQALPNMVVDKVRIKDKDGVFRTVKYDKSLKDEIVVPDSLTPTDEVKQRVMLVLQPELDINKEVQKRGRVYRSGEVLKPMYEYLCSAIPAEKRLQMMLQKKLRSLDANTSSNQKQNDQLLNISDFLNKYGDEIVVKYLMENTQLIAKLGDPLKMINSSGQVQEPETSQKLNAAHRVSGRVAVLSISEQEKFYNDVSERYEDHVKLLKSTGDYDLEVEYYDLQSEPLEKEILMVGTGGNSLFGRNTIIERSMINNLKKPYAKEELDLMIQESLSAYEIFPDPAKQKQRTLLDEQQEFFETRKNNLSNFYSEREKASIEKIEKDPKYLKLKERNPEEAKKWLETVSSSIRAKISEDLNYEKESMLNTYNYCRDFLKKIFVGMVTNYVRGEEEKATKVRMVVIDIIIDRNRANPWVPSNIKVKCAVANGIRAVIVPFSNDYFIREIIAEKELSSVEAKNVLEHWTRLTKESSVDRNERYIVTGNILQAMGNEEISTMGRLIKFTTNDKKVRNGILMYESFTPSKSQKGGLGSQVLIPAKFCMPLLDLMAPGKDTRYMTTNNIAISKDENEMDFIVRVRKGNDSNFILLNPTILEMVNESKGFTDWDNIYVLSKETGRHENYKAMGATIDRDRMPQFLDYIGKEYGAQFKIAKSIFEENKKILGIDITADYADGQKMEESESGLSTIKIDVNDPIYRNIVELQSDPVAEAGNQIEVIEPEPDETNAEPIVTQEDVIFDAEAKLADEKLKMDFEKQLLKLYKVLLLAPPAEVEKKSYGGRTERIGNYSTIWPDAEIDKLKVFHIVYFKPQSDVAYKESIVAPNEEEAKREFYKLHQSCQIEIITEAFAKGGLLDADGHFSLLIKQVEEAKTPKQIAETLTQGFNNAPRDQVEKIRLGYLSEWDKKHQNDLQKIKSEAVSIIKLWNYNYNQNQIENSQKKELGGTAITFYPFKKVKQYSEGDQVAYRDTFGEYTKTGTVTGIVKIQGVNLYSVAGALYTADELRPTTLQN